MLGTIERGKFQFVSFYALFPNADFRREIGIWGGGQGVEGRSDPCRRAKRIARKTVQIVSKRNHHRSPQLSATLDAITRAIYGELLFGFPSVKSEKGARFDARRAKTEAALGGGKPSKRSMLVPAVSR